MIYYIKQKWFQSPSLCPVDLGVGAAGCSVPAHDSDL